MVTGDLAQPLANAEAVYVEDGVICEVGSDRGKADTIVDAQGLTLMPGLVDGHTHPVFGDFAPPQNAVGWMEAYLHGGTTSIISAGELHLPGLPLEVADPKVFRYLAVLARRCFADYRPGGLKVIAGTMCLVPGMAESDFAELADEGCRLVKFIFYPYDERPEEAAHYVRWARAHGLVVKIHSGGVSRSGLSRPAGAAVIQHVQPDVVAHASGGPIPMPLDELDEVIDRTTSFLEVAYAGNPRWTVHLVEQLRARAELARLTVGTDTPSGTGTTPRGLLRTLCLICSLAEVPAAEAICLASGNTARAHHAPGGLIQPGCPADLVLMGRVSGSSGADALDSLRQGDLPGISLVMVDGEILVSPRSLQTPPPERLAVMSDGR